MTSNSSIRQRNTAVSEFNTNKNDMDQPLDAADRNMSFASLKKANPSHEGTVLKLHAPLFFSLIPACFVRILTRLLRYSSYTSHLTPTWKQRNLVILGNYIYRFNNVSSKSIKGSPIPLDDITVRLVSRKELENFYLDDLPPYCKVIFEISSVGKTRFYSVSSEEDAITWVNSIRQGQQECIKRKMGHSEHVPYPKEWKHIDVVGDRVLQRNERIKKRVRESEVRDIEMRSIGNVSGSSMSMGVFS